MCTTLRLGEIIKIGENENQTMSNITRQWNKICASKQNKRRIDGLNEFKTCRYDIIIFSFLLYDTAEQVD
jgi:hypothetical protein